MKDNKVNIAILGYGTVGAGVYQLLERQKGEIEPKTGLQAEVTKILVRDASRKRDGADQSLFTDSFDDILYDETIDIVVEVMGGTEPAKSYIVAALNAGKNVVTANKDLMAVCGGELLDLAARQGRDLMFEASVGGGIPVIEPMRQCLAGNHISDVMGIVNGTTNYILTKMSENGMEFDEALSQAQQLGYAEADPASDVGGLDAARKLAVLAGIAFNSQVTLSDVHVEGITGITAADISRAGELGYVIKLLAVARESDGEIEAGVQPMMLPVSHQLAQVNDVFNAVFIHGDAVDDIMLYGRGAGRFPTASAVVGDIIDVIRNIRYGCTGRISCSCYRNLPVKPVSETFQKYFIRILVTDRPGVLAGISSIMGDYGVSIKQMIQKQVDVDKCAELDMITDSVKEKDFLEAVEKIKSLDSVHEISSLIRVYDG